MDLSCGDVAMPWRYLAKMIRGDLYDKEIEL